MTTSRNGAVAGRRELGNLYVPLDSVALRAPVLPVEFYHFFCRRSSTDSSLLEFLCNEKIRLALDSTSPSLVRALLSSSKSEKDWLDVRRKFRRYLIRISTRPTPFGAFAGVAIAQLGKETSLQVNDTAVRYHKRLDVPWLLEFVQMLESDPEIFRQLRLQANPCTFTRGRRAYIRELNPLSETRDGVKNASLGASHLVSRALAASRKPISYDELSASLSASAHATESKIHNFIAELWRQGFLLTELRPPLTDGDPVPHILKRLQTLSGGERYRAVLERALAVADISGVSEHVAPAKSLDIGLLYTVKGKQLTHVDTFLSATGELNVAVAKEAALAAELLLSLTPWPSGPPHLQSYRRLFEYRYGADREVPLLEMTDPEYGIGLPQVYDGKKDTPAAETPAVLRARRETLFEIAQVANDERCLEIELNPQLQQQLRPWHLDIGSLPASLEINVFVSAASAHDLDDGRFTVIVGPNVGAMEGGRSLGRFAEFLGSAGTQAFRDAARSSEGVRSEKHSVELSYLPRNLELTNILVRPRSRRYEIDVGVSPGVPLAQSIPVSELVVGLRDGRFYLRWPKLDGYLSICSGHMANPQFAPSICRLLTEVTLDGTPMLREFDWGMASMLNFLPRVRFGRVILSVARWRISTVMAKKHFCLDNAGALQRSLNRWRTEWKVPRYVYLAEADNRLLLDLENEMDVEDLRIELSRLSENQALLLSEVYPGLEDTWLRGANGRFMAEYVVPLVLNVNSRPDLLRDHRFSVPQTPSTDELTTACRVKAPGSDWLYIKLYSAPSIADDILVGPISELVGWAQESDIIERWFFIRYADPEPHIRLRFQGSPSSLSESLLPRVFTWAQNLIKGDVCMRFTVDTYEREIDRYGGADSIEIAEQLFCVDSESALGMLRLLGPRYPLRRVELVVAGLDFLFQKMGYSSLDRLALFNGVAEFRHEASSAYRERKTVLQALIGVHHDPNIAAAIKSIFDVLEKNTASISDLGRRLQQLDAGGRLTLSLHAVFKSFAHMHCNRMGLDMTAERLAYGLLVRSYDSLHAFSKQNAGRQAVKVTGAKT